MTNPRTIACTAGHMVGGLILSRLERVRIKDLLNAFEGSGYLELIDEVTQYAPYACALFEAGYEAVGEYPGVGDYEVSEPFGQWMGGRIIELGGEVDPREAVQWLKAAMFEFFAVATEDVELRQRLRDALTAVEEPAND